MSEPSTELRPLIDDPEGVLDTDTVLRVVQPEFFDGRVPQSRAFQDQSLQAAHDAGLAGVCSSVNVKRIWEARSGELVALLAGFAPGSGIVQIPVAALRSLTLLGPNPTGVPQGVMLDPRPSRPWHAVTFVVNGGDKTKGMRRAIGDAASWLWHPDDG